MPTKAAKYARNLRKQSRNSSTRPDYRTPLVSFIVRKVRRREGLVVAVHTDGVVHGGAVLQLLGAVAVAVLAVRLALVLRVVRAQSEELALEPAEERERRVGGGNKKVSLNSSIRRQLRKMAGMKRGPPMEYSMRTAKNKGYVLGVVDDPVEVLLDQREEALRGEQAVAAGLVHRADAVHDQRVRQRAQTAVHALHGRHHVLRW